MVASLYALGTFAAYTAVHFHMSKRVLTPLSCACMPKYKQSVVDRYVNSYRRLFLPSDWNRALPEFDTAISKEQIWAEYVKSNPWNKLLFNRDEEVIRWQLANNQRLRDQAASDVKRIDQAAFVLATLLKPSPCDRIVLPAAMKVMPAHKFNSETKRSVFDATRALSSHVSMSQSGIHDLYLYSPDEFAHVFSHKSYPYEEIVKQNSKIVVQSLEERVSFYYAVNEKVFRTLWRGLIKSI